MIADITNVCKPSSENFDAGSSVYPLSAHEKVTVHLLECMDIKFNDAYGYATTWENSKLKTKEIYFFDNPSPNPQAGIVAISTEKLSSNLIAITEGNERGADIYYFWRSAPKKIFAYHLKFNLPDEADYTSKLQGNILTISRIDTLENKKFGKDITLIFAPKKGISEKK